MSAAPESVARELAARQRRQRAGRLRGLAQRAAALPLLADLITERELAERADYFAAEPTPHDREIATFRAAMAEQAAAGTAPDLGTLDHYLSAPYAMSGIRASYAALAYRGLGREVLDWLTYLRAEGRAARFGAYGPHYLADIWHTALVEAGERAAAWAIVIAMADDPAAVHAWYTKTFGPQPAPVPVPVQLSLFGEGA